MAFIGNTNTTQAFTPAIDYFSGNGSTTAFTLSRPVASVAQVQVTIDNVAQNPSSAFTVSANTITFTSAPLSGTNNIYVYYTSPITQVIAPSQGTVNATSLASSTGTGAVVLATSPTITTPTINSISSASATALTLKSAGTTAITVDTSQNVGIGTTSPTTKLHITGNLTIENSSNAPFINFVESGDNTDVKARIEMDQVSGTAGNLLFYTEGSGTLAERMRIDSSGNLLLAKTSLNSGLVGVQLEAAGAVLATRTSNPCFIANRLSTDGSLFSFRQDDTEEGTISVSGTTVSYNGGHLSRWAQMLTKPDLLKGTVMSNLDEMNVYIAPTTYWTEEDELPEGVNVGDVKVETHEVANEQLNKVKVSDVEGDANVAGVFVNWTYDEAHQVDEINMAMTGDMIIRIAQGVTVQRGDLLMSAGDGTAKAQGEDIVRSKTIAKVTSNHVTCTYADGSYCVPCVLMAC